MNVKGSLGAKKEMTSSAGGERTRGFQGKSGVKAETVRQDSLARKPSQLPQRRLREHGGHPRGCAELKPQECTQLGL